MGLQSKIRDRLTLPVVVAPMFLCSGDELAIEACKAGVVGSLTRNHYRDLEELDARLSTVSGAIARFRDAHAGRKIGPLAVNITPTTAEEMKAHVAVCRRHGVDIVITSVGDPTANAPLIHDAGLVHWHDATNLRFAEKAVAAGVDGVVAIGSGGGGHSGIISHLAFIPQVRAMFDGTVVMAGAVTTGAIVRAAEILGADLAYMGTRFIATKEAAAPDAYKQMILEGGTPDVMYHSGVNGMNAMWLKASLRAIGLDPDTLPPLTKRGTDHLPEGKKPWRDIWSAGQGIGLIHDLPGVAELVRRLQAEYVAACQVPDMAAAARAALQQPEPA
jgi:nitronate monooxygenase